MSDEDDDKPRPVLSGAFWAMLALAAASVLGSLMIYLAIHR